MDLSKNRRHNRQYFYKYTSAETACILLKSNTIRFSSPIILNDPFDVIRKIKLPFTQNEIPMLIFDRIKYILKNHCLFNNVQNCDLKYIIDNYNEVDKHEQKNILEQIYKSIVEGNIFPVLDMSEIQDTWTKMIPKTRILSLTEENDNPVMWSSYANNYKGVVLELECLDIHDSILLLAEPVIYSDEDVSFGTKEFWLDSIIGIQGFDYEETIKKLQLIKKLKWSYEKEWRIVSYDRNSNRFYRDCRLPRCSYRRVYFGKNIDDIDRNRLLEYKKMDDNLDFYDMELDYDKQKIRFEKIT